MTQPRPPITIADRKWRVTVLVLLIAVLLVGLGDAILSTTTTLGNRGVGRDNRVVECTTLHHVAPEVHLPQCA